MNQFWRLMMSDKKKVLIVVFGEFLPSSYVVNLLSTINELTRAGYEVSYDLKNYNQAWHELNHIFGDEAGGPREYIFKYEWVIVSDFSIMPYAADMPEILKINADVFTFNPLQDKEFKEKTDDKVPMFCWGFNPAVMKGKASPLFQLSEQSLTDGLLKSFDQVMEIPYKAAKWG